MSITGFLSRLSGFHSLNRPQRQPGRLSFPWFLPFFCPMMFFLPFPGITVCGQTPSEPSRLPLTVPNRKLPSETSSDTSSAEVVIPVGAVSEDVTRSLENARQQCEWYQKYLQLEQESDPFRKLNLGDQFLASGAPSFYRPLVDEQINRARYSMVQRVIDQGDLSRALQLAREHIERVPSDELVLNYELMRLAELKALQSGPASPVTSGYWVEAARLAERVRLAIVNENRQDQRLGEAKIMPWNMARPYLLSTLYRIEGLAAFVTQRFRESEEFFQKAIGQRCASPPDVYFTLGEIYDLYYDQRAAEFNRLSPTSSNMERRQILLREALAYVEQAAIHFARGLTLAESSEYRATYRDRRQDMRKRLEVSYEIWNGGRKDGLTDFLNRSRNFCQPVTDSFPAGQSIPQQLPTLRSRGPSPSPVPSP